MVPVLTFHAVHEHRSPVAVAPATFRKLVGRLAAAGWKTAPTGDVVAWARGGKAPPERSCLIAFDDGYASVLREAAPVLAAHGFRAIVFVTTGLVGRSPIFPSDELCPKEPALTWPELRQLAAAGFEIGSHACTHRALTRATDDELERELGQSRSELEQELGVAVRHHAYPFGSCNARVAAAAAKVYDGAFTTRLDWVRQGDAPTLLPRLDAHYLRYLADAGSLDSAGTRAWIAVRRFGRAVRGTGEGP